MLLLQLLLELVQTSLMLLLNIYLARLGYEDGYIAEINGWRYLGLLIFTFPFGLYIKGRRLKPYFIAASVIVPLCCLAMLGFIRAGMPFEAKLAIFFWGIGMMFIQVCTLPFILRFRQLEWETEAIALSLSTFAFGMLASGALVYLGSGISQWFPGLLDHPLEYYIMGGISILSLIGALIFAILLKENPQHIDSSLRKKNLFADLKSYNWDLILKSVIPTAVIAIGAGLTIPFLNLFFFKVFGMGSEGYSLLSIFTFVLVVIASLVNPYIRRRFGYKIAITLFQSLSVLMLVILALTELASDMSIMLYVASVAFIFRAPLMNMARPMTGELVMHYVGPRNQELISAMILSIWSGSWFFSAILFRLLRDWALPYYQIFLITAFIYVIGIALYYLLILDYSRRLSQNKDNQEI